MVAIIVAIIGTPFALMAEALICNVLAADTISAVKSKVATAGPARSINGRSTNQSQSHSSMLRERGDMIGVFRKIDDAAGATAEEEFRALRSDIRNYREALPTQQEKLDFDSKCYIVSLAK